MDCSWKVCCMEIPQRWVFAVMGCFAIMNAYAMRICLSLAITAIVTPTNTSSNSIRSDTSCPASKSISLNAIRGGTYEWDEYTQGIILSSFYWGYITTQFPGGLLATKFGGKYVLGLGIFFTAIFTLLTPMVVETYDAMGLIFLRILMGVGEGTTFPAMTVLVARWAPPNERSRINAVVMTGGQVGSIFGTAMSGYLIENSSAGWPMVFYVFGSLGIIWFIAWIMFCYNNPDEHPFISKKETDHLHNTMREHTHRQIQPTPWWHMITSIPLWALVVGKIGREWGFQVMFNDLPKYMNDVLKFSIQANGLLTAIPNFAMWAVSIGSSCLVDWLIKTNKISRTKARKTFTTISLVGPAIFMVGASYAGCDHTTVVVLFTVSMGAMGSGLSGILTNTLDLSPNYCGTLIALTNGISSICGMLVPYTVGLLTPNQALLEWRIVFWITFVIFCVSTLVFDFWGDGEVQYWNDLDSWVNKQKQLKYKEELALLEVSCAAHGLNPETAVSNGL